MSEPVESFYAIRRTDGEQIYDDYEWYGCDGPDDWKAADLDHAEPTEYEIVQMVVHPVAKRTFGGWELVVTDEGDES